MNIYKKIFRGLLFRDDAEQAHTEVADFGQSIQENLLLAKLMEKTFRYDDERLKTNVLGLDFANPVGMAAGFDKNAELIELCYCLGFGFTEIGSVTSEGGLGNDKPRLFRLLEDEAIINRMGLNNDGVEQIAFRLSQINRKFPLGVNIAKTHNPKIMEDKAIEDMVTAYRAVQEHADYVTANVSCPNTKEGKTFEDPQALKELLQEFSRYKTKPLVVKLSPDRTFQEIEKIISVSEDSDVNGYVIGNTSTTREGLGTSSEEIERIGMGGLSGQPIRERSTELVALIYKLTDKPIIGVGGVNSAEVAMEKIRAGASLVQLYTGLIYEGPGLIKRINQGIVAQMELEGYKSIQDMIGTK